MLVITKFTSKIFLQIFLLVFICRPLGHCQVDKINQEKLSELISYCDQTNSEEILIYHDNKEVIYWKNGLCDSLLYNTASMIKSWTGLAIGSLVDRSLIASIDDPVCKYIPEWEAGCENNVTIRHLLTMSAGINKRRGAEGILAVDDMNSYALNMDLDTLPGGSFRAS